MWHHWARRFAAFVNGRTTVTALLLLVSVGAGVGAAVSFGRATDLRDRGLRTVADAGLGPDDLALVLFAVGSAVAALLVRPTWTGRLDWNDLR